MNIQIGNTINPEVKLEIETLDESASLEFTADDRERCVVLLGGRCAVDFPVAGLHGAVLGDRLDVFDGPATAIYVPRSQRCKLVAEQGGAQVAVVSARARHDHPAYVITPEGLHAQRRGRGVWMRTVYDILGPKNSADRLLVGETFSREGVWSGYPPHKHDFDNPPQERRFEEIFFVRVKPENGYGILLHYPQSGAREMATVVKDGDTIFLSEGYHSFVAAAEYDFYYLWALVGDCRELAMVTDPHHRWILESPSNWEAQR